MFFKERRNGESKMVAHWLVVLQDKTTEILLQKMVQPSYHYNIGCYLDEK
jgi:hypothetical protein